MSRERWNGGNGLRKKSRDEEAGILGRCSRICLLCKCRCACVCVCVANLAVNQSDSDGGFWYFSWWMPTASGQTTKHSVCYEIELNITRRLLCWLQSYFFWKGVLFRNKRQPKHSSSVNTWRVLYVSVKYIIIKWEDQQLLPTNAPCLISYLSR